MKRLFLLFILAAAPAAAQTGVHPPQGWSLGLAGGGAAFSDFQRTELMITRPSTSGPEQQDFSRRIGAQTTGTLSGWLSYWPTGSWGVRAYTAYSPSRFKTLVSKSATEFMAGSSGSGPDTVKFASLGISALQLQAIFRFPVIHGHVMPYGILGGGATRYSVASGPDPVPAEAGQDLGPGTRRQFAGSIGLGAMLQTRRPGWGLNFELMDQLARTPIRSGPVRVLNAVSFTIGLSWRLSGR